MATEPLRIRDLSGGIADGHPAQIPDTCVTEASNVEFWDGRCGGRRNGSTAVKSSLTNPRAGMFTHTPSAGAADDRLWTMASAGDLAYYDSAYTETVPTIAALDNFLASAGVDWATLHGKLFIACDNETSGAVALSRLHVFDGTQVRRVGQAPPAAAPTATDNGVGLYTATRKFRVRFIVMSGSTVLLRSEPSAELTHSPSGTGSGVTVTRPTAVETATHWELEEVGLNGVDWYRTATIVIATTTSTTTIVLPSVSTTGTLSADIGTYALLPSAKYLTVDDDRLVYAADHEDATKGSRVGWTPVGGDSTAVGNDERVPTAVSGFLDFDSLDSGDITGIKGWEGKVIVFKLSQVHQMVRTGSRTRAYLPDTLSRVHGAVPHSIMEGTDRETRSCLLFIDQDAGPMKLGTDGLQILLDERMRRLWKETFNKSATYRVSCVWNAKKGQGWWHIASGSATAPDIRWVYESTTEGITFQTMPNPARTAAYFAGYPHFSADTGTATGTNRIIKGDHETATTDYSTTFRAYLRTKAFQLGNLQKRFTLTAAVLEASALAGVSLTVSIIRDYGRETLNYTASLAPVGSEEYVSVPMDNAAMGEAVAAQIEIGDATARDVAAWQVHGLMATWTPGSPTTGA